MRERLLDFLRCPDCKQKLELAVFDVSGDEISEGMLYCSNEHFFPVVRGIPRMLPSSLKDNWEIPGVVHVDGTARPQMVNKDVNPCYWNLINEFRKLTGIPMLLNTSFNIQGPIVCSPQDAINTFKNASFDALVLENNLVLRKNK